MGKHQISTEPAILKAAERVFLEKGLEGARTAEIAKEAGVNTGVLHYFFKTKEDLYNRIIQEKYLNFSKSLVDSLREISVDLKTTVRTISESVFDFFMKNPELPLFVYKEYPRHPEQVKMLGKAVRGAPDAPVDRLQEEIDAEGLEGVKSGLLFYQIVSINLFGALAVKMALDLKTYYTPTEEEYVIKVREDCVFMIMGLLYKNKTDNL